MTIGDFEILLKGFLMPGWGHLNYSFSYILYISYFSWYNVSDKYGYW